MIDNKCTKIVDSAMESLHDLVDSIEEDATKKLFFSLCDYYGRQFIKEKVLNDK